MQYLQTITSGATQAADSVLADLSCPEIERIRRRYADNRHLKYINDLERFVRRDLRICEFLGLDRAPRRNVLDIGCGTGLLLHCMQRYGHTGVGIDVPDPFYADMARFYGVDRRTEAVRPFQSLQVEGIFDLITCIAVTFDRIFDEAGNRVGVWTPSEWRFFLVDLESRLSPQGRVFLKLNKTGDAMRPHDAFAVGSTGSNRFQRLFDCAGLARTIRALEKHA